MIDRQTAYDSKKNAKNSLVHFKTQLLILEKDLADRRSARILQGFDGKTNEAQREAVLQTELAPEIQAVTLAKINVLKAQAIYDNACLDVNFVDFRVDADE